MTRFAFPLTTLGRWMGSVGRAENARNPIGKLLKWWQRWAKVLVVDLEWCWSIQNMFRGMKLIGFGYGLYFKGVERVVYGWLSDFWLSWSNSGGSFIRLWNSTSTKSLKLKREITSRVQAKHLELCLGSQWVHDIMMVMMILRFLQDILVDNLSCNELYIYRLLLLF